MNKRSPGRAGEGLANRPGGCHAYQSSLLIKKMGILFLVCVLCLYRTFCAYCRGIDSGGRIIRRMDSEIGYSLAERMVRAPRHAAEVRNPKACALALEMLADGCGTSEIVKATGLTAGILARLRYDHNEAISVRREKAADDAEHMAERYRAILEEKANMLLDDPDLLKKVNPRDLAVTYEIFRSKASSLRGEATAVVEHRKGVSLEDAKKALEAAQKRIQGESIDV